MLAQLAINWLAIPNFLNPYYTYSLRLIDTNIKTLTGK